MKSLLKSFLLVGVIAILTACGNSKSTGWQRLPEAEIDQKSYAIAYGATVQTYLDRVNESYDVNSFIKGVDDWYNKKVPLPVEQIRAGMLNRMLDNDVYAYYNGALHAAELQNNAIRLSPKCWEIVQPASITQGMYDAMVDLQKNKVRDDEYIKKGAEQILHQCVENIEADAKANKKAKKQK